MRTATNVERRSPVLCWQIARVYAFVCTCVCVGSCVCVCVCISRFQTITHFKSFLLKESFKYNILSNSLSCFFQITAIIASHIPDQAVPLFIWILSKALKVCVCVWRCFSHQHLPSSYLSSSSSSFTLTFTPRTLLLSISVFSSLSFSFSYCIVPNGELRAQAQCPRSQQEWSMWTSQMPEDQEPSGKLDLDT